MLREEGAEGARIPRMLEAGAGSNELDEPFAREDARRQRAKARAEPRCVGFKGQGPGLVNVLWLDAQRLLVHHPCPWPLNFTSPTPGP